MASIASDIRARGHAVSRFFSHDIWEARLDELPHARAVLYQSARIAHATVHGLLFEDGLHVRAAALTYFTVLSIVPLLAFVFALLKGFGAYRLLIEETIRPYVLRAVAENSALQTAFEQILNFVANTGVTSLGLIGLLTLLYAATRLLRNIEIAFNEVWGASAARGVLDQLRDYLALIVITPICLMAAAALTTVGQAVSMLRSAGEALGLSAVIETLVGVLGPLLALFIGLMALYVVMPNTRVRAKSAIVGAIVGGIGWYVLLVAHVKFQVGVARFNALYSSFGAIPIFLAWLQVSWVVVLLGAKVAATHQQTQSLAQHERMKRADQALREAVCLSVMLRVTRAFLRGDKPVTLDALAAQLDAPPPALRDWLERLVDAECLVRTQTADSTAYVLAIAPERIHVKDVLDAMRHERAHGGRFGDALRVDPEASALWQDLDAEFASSRANRSLRELASTDRNPSARDARETAARDRPV